MNIFLKNDFTPTLDSLHNLLDKTTDKEVFLELEKNIKQLSKFEQHYSMLSKAIDASIIIGITDQRGCIVYVNEKFCEISKYSRSELLGQNHRIVNSGYHEKDFFKEMWRTIAHGEVWEGEVKNRAKDGSNYWVKTTILPILDDRGKPSLYISLRTDITEGKVAQEKLVEALNNSAQEEIKFMAYHDSLTNLPNKRMFNEDMTKLITHSSQVGQDFAVVFLDLDRFKQINDSLGHTIGDMLIQEVAIRLKERIGSRGRIYRFAGDEFILVFPGCTKDGMEEVSEELLSVFEEVFVLANSYQIFTTPSIGISIFPEHGQDFDTLLKNADTAMFVAKSNGRNTYQVYEAWMNEHHREALTIEQHLRQAIEKNEFEIYFQPKMDLSSERIKSMETLLRWKNPILGNVQPDKFIPIAEETGLIIKIDEWVLEQACRQNKEWNDARLTDPLRIAVNISALHFRLPNFVSLVEDTLKKTGLAPELLEIEITESSFIDNIDECINSLTKLRNMGVFVAIDDFGIGYSSLNYLRKFPISSLKIDRSFIQEIAENQEEIAIVRAMIYLSHELNLRVVAEGTETKEVIELLRELGCNEVQGYYVSRPVPKQEFEKIVRRINGD